MVGLREGLEVLVRRAAGSDDHKMCNYMGVIVEVDKDNYLVRFPDCSESWYPFDAIVALDDDEDDDDQDYEESKDDVKSKDLEAGRIGDLEDDEPLFKRRCLNTRKLSRSSSSSSLEWKEKSSSSSPSLPYHMSDLVWNEEHTRNAQTKYCYCGQSGTWYKRMLQCELCLQWFHAKCLQTSTPTSLLMGDAFFEFRCSLCNHNEESLRRIDVPWRDAIHLILFNLTLTSNKKYHDVHTAIVPLLKRQLRSLQGPSCLLKMAKLTSQGHEFILQILREHKTVFSCAAEHKKSSNFYGLRLKAPPKVWPSAKTLISQSVGQSQKKSGLLRQQKKRRKDLIKRRDDVSNDEDISSKPLRSSPALKFTPPLPPPPRLKCKSSSKRPRGRPCKGINSSNSTMSDKVPKSSRAEPKGLLDFVDPFACLGLRTSRNPSKPCVQVFLDECKPSSKGDQLRVVARRVTPLGLVQHMVEYD